jgi:hypothetical protein
MIELQEIIKQFGDAFLESHRLSYDQTKAYRAILNCRTSVMGGHIDVCDHCDYQQHSYNSCRNRHCPKCQTTAKEQWIDRQCQNLLEVPYFHVVFTLPDSLNPIMYQNQDVMYDLFFKAASETLMELSIDPKYLGARPGITIVMHTWGQNLLYHPHLHCIVTGGGLTSSQTWVDSRKKFFIPVKVLSKKFRGKFLAYLGKVKLNFFNDVADLDNPVAFSSFVATLYEKQWVTYCKPPFEGPSKVIAYLGRYTHRVAISNNRILRCENGLVTFSWRDYKDSNTIKEMTVSAVEFIRRFMLHILPGGFRKIRHYGVVTSRDKSKRIALCRKLIEPVRGYKPPTALRSAIEILKDIFGVDFNLCPNCCIGHLTRASPKAA